MKTDLLSIPYVGKNTKAELEALGITCIEDLVGISPEDLYLADCRAKKRLIDRCQLYVFRLAIYYAEHSKHDPEKLKWWYWKDIKYENVRR